MANEILKRDQNFVTVLGAITDDANQEIRMVRVDPTTNRILASASGMSAGTVTSVSVVTANGFAGSVATATTTPAITISTTVNGLIKGNGTSLSAAVAGTDYQAPITLTTTGSSGAATFIGNTLNIPNYAAGTGTVTTVSVVTANGISGSVANATTTPAITLTLGAITPTSVNGLTITSNGTNTLNIAAGKTFVVSNSITLAGTDSTVMTFPTTSATLARIDAGNTFTGSSTASAWVLTSPTITTKISPTTDDGAPLGDVTHNFSDLFLASGAVINFANGNVVLTHTSAVLTVGTGDFRVSNAGTNNDSVVTNNGTQTLTNKRVNPRTSTVASSATPSINTDTTDEFTITALAVAITSFTTNLTGTPVNAQKLIIRILDNGTPRALAWGASFASRGATLPTTTVLSKYLYVGFIWNSTTTTWDCVAMAQEA